MKKWFRLCFKETFSWHQKTFFVDIFILKINICSNLITFFPKYYALIGKCWTISKTLCGAQQTWSRRLGFPSLSDLTCHEIRRFMAHNRID